MAKGANMVGQLILGGAVVAAVIAINWLFF
jgi:hypothetical protein